VWPRGDQDRDRARAIFNKVHFSFFWLEKHKNEKPRKGRRVALIKSLLPTPASSNVQMLRLASI
jgi:hypothetical protein